MKVSVIIPLYNKAPYVKKTLDSVCAQTYQDFECVIMDDGSTDDSADIVNQWLHEKGGDCRFRVLSQANSGVAAARNNAVAVSHGELISFLDADDWWEPTFLNEMVHFTERTPEAGIWASNYIYYKPGKTRVGVTNISYTDREKGLMNYPKSYFEGTGMPITSISMMMRRSVFDEMGGFPLGVRLGEDFLLWATIALRYPVAFLDKPLAYYNNDVPPSMRATRNLHQPERAMYFLFGPIELEALSKEEPLRTQWKRLLDHLRAVGLKDYWLDKRFHSMAESELLNVDWSLLPASAAAFYNKPAWLLRYKRQFMQIASYCKYKLIRILKIK